MRKRGRKIGVGAQKILLLLLGGMALGLSNSPGKYKQIAKAVAKEWKLLNNKELHRNIHRLYESKLIAYKENKDGSVSITLTENGREKALCYKIDEMSIPKPNEWDKKWRVIIFDVPEEQKLLRDTLRTKLKNLGLLELQKSVFVHPYECRNEIDFIIELYDARRYVRFIESAEIDNELHLKKRFRLL